MNTRELTPVESCRTLLPRLPEIESKVFRTSKTVLLAEDNDDLRFVMECSLATMGYRVVACADAWLAATAFHADPTIDILMTDFEMPTKSGIELARELTSVRKALPVMIVTGSLLCSADLQEIQDRRWAYLCKPCHLSALESILKQMLLPDLSLAT